MARACLDPNGVVLTKKVKLPRGMADALERLAAESNQSESEVIRHGIELVERERRRDRAHAWLVKTAAEDAARYRGRKPTKLRLK